MNKTVYLYLKILIQSYSLKVDAAICISTADLSFYTSVQCTYISFQQKKALVYSLFAILQ